MKNPTEIILYPLMTEKCLDKVDKENKVTFIVKRSAGKAAVRDAVEKLYNVKVANVNTQITMRGQKKATVQLAEGHSAEDLVGGMGVL